MDRDKVHSDLAPLLITMRPTKFLLLQHCVREKNKWMACLEDVLDFVVMAIIQLAMILQGCLHECDVHNLGDNKFTVLCICIHLPLHANNLPTLWPNLTRHAIRWGRKGVLSNDACKEPSLTI